MNHESDSLIIGGGIAGLSLAYFLDKQSGITSTILERDEVVGGLCRSYSLNGIPYDVGPHIIFSKHQEVLDLHTKLIETNRIRRSNQIFFKGRYVKYPFENDLSKLDEEDRDYCVKEFVQNPYESYKPASMQQFFLSTFGEGITRLYLQPYNEKIWKYDPAYMDTQMVERIPKPPKEDVIRSAQGAQTEGYLHQLYFHYPKTGGFQTLVDRYASLVRERNNIKTGIQVEAIRKVSGQWVVSTNQGEFRSKRLFNCIPLHEFFKLIDAPPEVRQSLDKLLYNSIHIVMVQAKKDAIGDHFALYLPEKDIIFHRLSKLNFLGSQYCLPGGGSTLMAEITFRPGSYVGSLPQKEIEQRVLDGLGKLGFVEPHDVTAVETRTFKYAYVIYDIDHRRNTDHVLGYLESQQIISCGRFAEFEYLNSDQVVHRAMMVAKRAAKID